MKIELSQELMDELNTMMKDRVPVIRSLDPAGLLLGPIPAMPSKALFVPLTKESTPRLVDFLVERGGDIEDNTAHFPRVFLALDNGVVIIDNPLSFGSKASKIFEEFKKALCI